MGNLANRFKPSAPSKPPAREHLIKAAKEPSDLVNRGPKPTGTAKKMITLRLDPAVLDHYRATGDGWQTRINDDLVKLNGL